MLCLIMNELYPQKPQPHISYEARGKLTLLGITIEIQITLVLVLHMIHIQKLY